MSFLRPSFPRCAVESLTAAPDFWELRGEQGNTNNNLLC